MRSRPSFTTLAGAICLVGLQVMMTWSGQPATAADLAEACFEHLRRTDDGQRVEAFLRDAQRDLGPAAVLLGDESLVLRRVAESADPATREANHDRLHLLLGARLDDATHGAMHALALAMHACADHDSR